MNQKLTLRIDFWTGEGAAPKKTGSSGVTGQESSFALSCSSLDKTNIGRSYRQQLQTALLRVVIEDHVIDHACELHVAQGLRTGAPRGRISDAGKLHRYQQG